MPFSAACCCLKATTESYCSTPYLTHCILLMPQCNTVSSVQIIPLIWNPGTLLLLTCVVPQTIVLHTAYYCFFVILDGHIYKHLLKPFRHCTCMQYISMHECNTDYSSDWEAIPLRTCSPTNTCTAYCLQSWISPVLHSSIFFLPIPHCNTAGPVQIISLNWTSRSYCYWLAVPQRLALFFCFTCKRPDFSHLTLVTVTCFLHDKLHDSTS